jgi:hypothetical protein
MGMLDMLTGGMSIETFTPFILKEMKKSNSKNFIVSELDGKINIMSFEKDLVAELKESNRQLNILKDEYLKLKKELHALKNQNNGRD